MHYSKNCKICIFQLFWIICFSSYYINFAGKLTLIFSATLFSPLNYKQVKKIKMWKYYYSPSKCNNNSRTQMCMCVRTCIGACVCVDMIFVCNICTHIRKQLFHFSKETISPQTTINIKGILLPEMQ